MFWSSCVHSEKKWVVFNFLVLICNCGRCQGTKELKPDVSKLWKLSQTSIDSALCRKDHSYCFEISTPLRLNKNSRGSWIFNQLLTFCERHNLKIAIVHCPSSARSSSVVRYYKISRKFAAKNPRQQKKKRQ